MEHSAIAGLCRSRIFLGLEPEQLERILPCITSHVQEYPPAARANTEKGALGLLLRGDVKLCDTAHAATGETVGSHELFGEAGAFCQDAQNYALQTDSGASVLYLRPEFFFRLCEHGCPGRGAHREVQRNLLGLMSERAARQTRKIAYLCAPDLKAKIAMYLLEQLDKTGELSFVLPLNRDRLADFFAVARPSLSRELMFLRRQGLIELNRSKVTILDPDGLRAMLQG